MWIAKDIPFRTFRNSEDFAKLPRQGLFEYSWEILKTSQQQQFFMASIVSVNTFNSANVE